ncbi:MAG: L,D-transpeptidase [Deltaproteobacteria bacterium]|nr:L,D-transpeptidase [Deltaproteobacteria bacterium]
MPTTAVVALALLAAAPATTSVRTYWVEPSQVFVQVSASHKVPHLAILERGNAVQVVGCVPDCAAKDAWALLSPAGALPLALLSPEPVAGAIPVDARFVYGHAKPGAAIHAGPDAKSPRISRAAGDITLAFVDDAPLAAKGWLRAVDGGYVSTDDVHLIQPSTFSGLHNPPDVVAFFLKTTKAKRIHGDPSSTDEEIARLAWREVIDEDHDVVHVPQGNVPRSAVRIAKKRERPAAIPPDAHWVVVDLDQQTLTAYEGDKLVFATLVSTGKPTFETGSGLFQVWYKTRHTTMNGRREPYHVEEVPDVLYFHGPDGLHGTFWHERFGHTASHGCVNLSPADARWLFDWAPPTIPDGWHGVFVQPGETSLWVWVMHGDKAPTTAQAAPLSRPEGSPEDDDDG